jgi:hypothetical protein
MAIIKNGNSILKSGNHIIKGNVPYTTNVNTIVYYKLDDLTDSGPSGYTLSRLVPTPFPTYPISGITGKINTCYSNSGYTNYTLSGSSALYRATTDFCNESSSSANTWTISIWYKPRDITYGWLYFLQRSVGTIRYIDGACPINNSVVIYCGKATHTFTISKTPTLNQWHNFIYTRNGITNNIYIDGKLEGTYDGYSSDLATGQRALGIGAYTYQVPSPAGGCLDGLLDEFIWENKVWSLTDIQQYYNKYKI